MAFPDDVLSEDLLREYVDLLVRLVEAAGAGAAVRFVVAAIGPGKDGEFTQVRLSLGRYLVLRLEFQLASDILSTAIAPTFEEIGQLAATRPFVPS